MRCHVCGRDVPHHLSACASCGAALDEAPTGYGASWPPVRADDQDTAAVAAASSFDMPTIGAAVATPPPVSGGRAIGSTARDAAGPLHVGESFGKRYHIVQLLGMGGMGAVYRAWDSELGVLVAIKVILPSVMNDPVAADQ